MFIVLDIRYSLVQITIWANTRCIKTILNFAQELFNNWNSVFTDHNSFHFIWLDLTIPFVLSNVSNCETFGRIGIQNFAN